MENIIERCVRRERWVVRKSREREREGESIACRRRDSETRRERRSCTFFSSVFHMRFHLASRQYHGDPRAPQNISLLSSSPYYSPLTYLLPSFYLFPPFRDPRLCSALYFFRARNHRERKTPFRSPKETTFPRPPPAPPDPFVFSFLHGLPENEPKRCKRSARRWRGPPDYRTLIRVAHALALSLRACIHAREYYELDLSRVSIARGSKLRLSVSSRWRNFSGFLRSLDRDARMGER